MKLKRHLAEPILKLLDSSRVKLKPALSRCRNRFLQFCSTESARYGDDKRDVQLEHVSKDKEGNYLWDNDTESNFNFQERLSEEEYGLFIKDLEELHNEDMVYEDNETNKPIFTALRLILVDLDIELSPQEEFIYDVLCDELDISLDDSLQTVISQLPKENDNGVS